MDRLEGSFGNKGKFVISNDGENEKTITYHAPPFNFPNRIRRAKNAKKNNYTIFGPIENSSDDNKQSGAYSLMLSVTIDEDASNLDSILDEFKQQFSSLQNRYWYNSILSGQLPTFEPIRGKEFPEIIREQRKANKIVTRHNAIDKNLIGLHCYDLHESGKKLDAAAEELAALFSKKNESNSYQVETIKKYYNSTRKNILNIRNTLAEL